ncbi:Interleukin-1 receptor-associated kinase 3 [Liparis tanakae]|uniref:Interleukin-1 receptor-associated kinase 3 n=1 Tax=Liparis tanakae TaxID=230148 RepID=A0A4Z2I5Z1_9TELE|nr:Interleukin-1 receptor-associated kinase 3 [Liparis tanakae]
METVTGRKVTEDAPKQTALRDLLVAEVEDGGGVDSCVRFLDETAGRWPPAVALDLLRLALDCVARRRRSRPSMENVSETISFLFNLNIKNLAKISPTLSCESQSELRCSSTLVAAVIQT